MIINVSFLPYPIYVQFRYNGKNSATTICAIYEYTPKAKVEELRAISSGVAYCHPNDKPNKEKGRKVALANAMDSASEFNGLALNKAENRREVWNAYHSRSPKYANYINQGKAA